MKEMFFEDDIDDSKYLGHLYGLGTSHVVPSPSTSTPVSTAAAAAAVAAATGELNDSDGKDGTAAAAAVDGDSSSKADASEDKSNGLDKDVSPSSVKTDGVGEQPPSAASSGENTNSQDSNFAPIMGGVSSLLIGNDEPKDEDWK